MHCRAELGSGAHRLRGSGDYRWHYAQRRLWSAGEGGIVRSRRGSLVAAKTGLSQSEAETRVSEVVTEARQAADTARKATARLLLWMFIAPLIGAYCASYAATIGGRQRDHVKAI